MGHCKRIFSSDVNGGLIVWQLDDGRQQLNIKTGYGRIRSLELSPDEKYLLVAGDDRYARLLNPATGRELVALVAFSDQEWLSITPTGHYDASTKGAKHINVSIGNAIYSMDNFFETYFRPDLVQTSIKNLEAAVPGSSFASALIKSPPEMALFVKSKQGSWLSAYDSLGDMAITNGAVTVKVKATDTTGGIKEIRLFLNDKLVESELRGMAFKTVPATCYEKQFTIALSDGNKEIKAIGFSDDMTQSNPVVLFISYKPGTTAKPDMYVLAIGINNYRNNKYNLSYCVPDCNAFVETLQPRAAKLFNQVKIDKFTDDNATKLSIAAKLKEYEQNLKATDALRAKMDR